MPEPRSLAVLPKAHLHLHFEESIRQSTLDEFAIELGHPTLRMTDFASFIEFDELCQAAVDVMRTPGHLARMVREMAEDAAAHGCLWIEPAVWLPLHRRFIGADERTLELLVDAGRAATAATGVGIGWVLAINRNEPLEQAMDQARIAARWAGRGVVGLGLHNDESRFPAGWFRDAFDVIGDTGLLRVPHAGELAGAASVRMCVEMLGADRIQHGVRVLEDPAVVELVIANDVCLDVCPTSNVVMGFVLSYDEHPLPALVDAGLRVSVNADDPVSFGCDILSEYELCRETFGLDDRALARIARDSLLSSAAPAEIVAAGSARIDAWIGDGS